jgi:tripartite-type tricarboxylate transporter receptor subunit TctC
MAGIDIVHIAYRGATPALADLMAGQVPISISNLPAIIGPAQAGRMRPLAVTSAKRAAQMPNVPTMIESGLPGYEVTSWYGVCAPARTPRHVIDKWHGDLVRVLNLPDVRKRFTELVIEPAPTSQGEFASFIRNETQRWARVVKDAKLEPL